MELYLKNDDEVIAVVNEKNQCKIYELLAVISRFIKNLMTNKIKSNKKLMSEIKKIW